MRVSEKFNEAVSLLANKLKRDKTETVVLAVKNYIDSTYGVKRYLLEYLPIDRAMAEYNFEKKYGPKISLED